MKKYSKETVVGIFVVIGLFCIGYMTVNPLTGNGHFNEAVLMSLPPVHEDQWIKHVRFNKPAVISTHRVNYIGGLNPDNRENGLRNLDSLLNRIVQKWDDIEFISSRINKNDYR